MYDRLTQNRNIFVGFTAGQAPSSGHDGCNPHRDSALHRGCGFFYAQGCRAMQMGFNTVKAIQKASPALRALGLSSGDITVLMALGERLNEKTRLCFPTRERIAADTGLCERQVQRATKKLKDAGVIDFRGSCWKNGKRLAREFTLCIPPAQLGDISVKVGRHSLQSRETNVSPLQGSNREKEQVILDGNADALPSKSATPLGFKTGRFSDRDAPDGVSQDLWTEWIQHRDDIEQPAYGKQLWTREGEFLARLKPDRQRREVENAIGNGWRTLCRPEDAFAKSGQRGSYLPATFALTDERRAIAKQFGIDPEHIFKKFIAFFHNPDADTPRRKNWDTEWLNWCRTERKTN